MKFEDALKELREGKKIRHAHFAEDEYLMACYVSIKPWFDLEGLETREKIRERGLSITKMKGENVHLDMMVTNEDLLNPRCKHGLAPQLDLLSIMSNEWEIV